MRIKYLTLEVDGSIEPGAVSLQIPNSGRKASVKRALANEFKAGERVVVMLESDYQTLLSKVIESEDLQG